MEKGADALPSNGRKAVCLAPIFESLLNSFLADHGLIDDCEIVRGSSVLIKQPSI